MGLFTWSEKPSSALQGGGVIGPDERLPWAQTGLMGVQHVIAMFGSTVLAPILMGFDPNPAVLMSGIGTLIFFLITGGKVPSYLGSSFAFIGVVIAATGYAGQGANANIGLALGGIIACGAVYTLVGLLVQAIGTGWIEKLMPPVVTGAVVAIIGLNLAAIPIKNMAANNFEAWMQAMTFTCVALVAVFTRGMLQRLLILLGLTHSLWVKNRWVYSLVVAGTGTVSVIYALDAAQLSLGAVTELCRKLPLYDMGFCWVSVAAVMLAVSLLPFVIHMSGVLYLICALALGARFLQWAVVLYRGTRPHAAINTFKYSIYYLFLLFIALLVDHYLLLNL